jgi:hypothetical protein
MPSWCGAELKKSTGTSPLPLPFFQTKKVFVIFAASDHVNILFLLNILCVICEIMLCTCKMVQYIKYFVSIMYWPMSSAKELICLYSLRLNLVTF